MRFKEKQEEFICPKTGKVIRKKSNKTWKKWLIPFTGFIAFVWFLIRVIPKPSRASYPCQRASAPLAAGFVVWLTGIFGSAALFRKSGKFLRQYRYITGVFLLIAAVILSGVTFVNYFDKDVSAVTADAYTPQTANAPIGVAKGIMPGRVSWVHDRSATKWDGSSNYWYSDSNTDQTVVNRMFDNVVCSVANQNNVSSAWDALFKYFNNNNGNGNKGYTPGEKIAIKVNLNNKYSGNMIDASPHMVYAVLNHLVNVVGVKQSDITVFDSSRTNIEPIRSRCRGSFPNVIYNDTSLRENSITYSKSITSSNSRKLGTPAVNAKYLINMAILKRHGMPKDNWIESNGNTAITLCGKNLVGTTGDIKSLHNDLRDWNDSGASYNPIVDLMGSKNLGGKTVLYIVDGLYSGNLWNSKPQKWSGAPFNNHWPSSIFVSQDPVAIDSVGLDFMRSQWTLMKNADNYLHEAAQIDAPPSGTTYKPDGVKLKSLGVHEHWNNANDKKYSRNLGTGNGIELVPVSNSATTPMVSPTPKSTPTATISTVIYGDVNGDKAVNSLDFAFMRQYLLGIISVFPGESGYKAADVDGNGTFNAIDYGYMKQYLLGIIDRFKAG